MKKLLLTFSLITLIATGVTFAGSKCWKSECVGSGMCAHIRQSPKVTKTCKQMMHNRMCKNDCHKYNCDKSKCCKQGKCHKKGHRGHKHEHRRWWLW